MTNITSAKLLYWLPLNVKFISFKEFSLKLSSSVGSIVTGTMTNNLY